MNWTVGEKRRDVYAVEETAAGNQNAHLSQLDPHIVNHDEPVSPSQRSRKTPETIAQGARNTLLACKKRERQEMKVKTRIAKISYHLKEASRKKSSSCSKARTGAKRSRKATKTRRTPLLCRRPSEWNSVCQMPRRLRLPELRNY
jgi:hypothetical protein